MKAADRAVGNGAVLFLMGEEGMLHIGSCRRRLFSVGFGDTGRYIEEDPDSSMPLSFSLYAEGKPEDPRLMRSSVRVSVYPDERTASLVCTLYAMHELTLSIEMEEGVRLTRFERLAKRMDSRPALKMTTKDGEALYLVCDGNYRFEEDEQTVTIGMGYTRFVLYLQDGTEGLDRLFNLYETAIVPYGERLPQNYAYLSAVKKRRRRPSRKIAMLPPRERQMALSMTTLAKEVTSSKGGYYLNRGPIALADMCQVASLFVSLGERAEAERFLNFLLFLLRRYDRLPQFCLADGSQPSFQTNVPDVAAEYAACLVAQYERTFSLSAPSALKKALFRLIKEEQRLLRGGTMPFSPWERCLPRQARFGHSDGSAEATLRCFAAGRAVLSFSEDAVPHGARAKLAGTLDHVAASFPKRFVFLSETYLNCPDKERGARRYSKVDGFCDACHRRACLSLVGDGYLCEDCRAKERVPEETVLSRIKDEGVLARLASILGVSTAEEPATSMPSNKTLSPVELVARLYFEGMRDVALRQELLDAAWCLFDKGTLPLADACFLFRAVVSTVR